MPDVAEEVKFKKGDIVHFRSDPKSTDYSDQWFNGYRGPLRVTESRLYCGIQVYVSRLDGSLWENREYSTIYPWMLRLDIFLTSAQKAIKKHASTV